MQILLTGATGFIGSEVLCQLLAKVDVENIVLLGRSKPKSMDSLLGRRLNEHFSSAKARTVFDSLRFVEVDFLDEAQFQRCLEKLAQGHNEKWIVIHMAAQVKAPSYEKEMQQRVNVGVTGDLCAWSEKHASQFVFISSVVAFGTHPDAVVRTEADFSYFPWLSSKMSYFQSKREAHLKMLQAQIPAVSVLCPSIVHGSLEEEKNSRGHLRAVKEGRLRFAPSGGINIVSLRYVAKNIIELALNAKARGAETYLLVGENITLQNYLQKYQDLHGKVEGLVIYRIPKTLALPFIALFYVWKYLGLPTSTSLETAVASFGYLYFKSQKLSPDEKVKY